jgi:hypothetical protein
VEELNRWNDDYAAAMRGVYEDYGNDLDIAALFAEAMMNRTPWQLWDLQAGGIAEDASTVEATEVLERALEDQASRRHPGVLHMYIHLMEMSPHPERALRACDWLRGLVPDAGHLEHMPTHIDVLCGHYHNVVEWNRVAIVADRVTALYLSTGAPTVALITVGMVLAPQMVAQQKLRGVFDYQRAMPLNADFSYSIEVDRRIVPLDERGVEHGD